MEKAQTPRKHYYEWSRKKWTAAYCGARACDLSMRPAGPKARIHTSAGATPWETDTVAHEG
jgi:hypothetical protein